MEQSLESIGFYTLSDARAKNSSTKSPLWRCEVLLTSACNFRCPYCRGLKPEQKGRLERSEAFKVVELWCADGLKNVRFSGGEPTLHPDLIDLVSYCKDHGVEHIAVSTNGSQPYALYETLMDAGVNDFSISLDGACCATSETMTGGVKDSFDRVVDNIKRISERTYVTVGMVFTEQNVEECERAVRFAQTLGVADIRVIPSAQYNKALESLSGLPDDILDTMPVLKYRINNLRDGKHVRGIPSDNKHKCKLVLDDMAVVQGKHYPCIIYLREGGEAIGDVSPTMREDRKAWMEKHNPCEDKICKEMCLDVCVAFNAKAAE